MCDQIVLYIFVGKDNEGLATYKGVLNSQILKATGKNFSEFTETEQNKMRKFLESVAQKNNIKSKD